jgi:hypothetical protein
MCNLHVHDGLKFSKNLFFVHLPISIAYFFFVRTYVYLSTYNHFITIHVQVAYTSWCSLLLHHLRSSDYAGIHVSNVPTLEIQLTTGSCSFQGCQIFLDTYQHGKNIPNDQKYAKISTKYTKWQ